MLVLSKKDIQSVFSMKDAIDTVKQAYVIYSEGRSVVPLRVNIDMPEKNSKSLFMPGYIEELAIAGIKIVSVFPGNKEKGLPSVPAKMLLISGETGEVCCMMDGTYLTQLRTGAAAGAATDLLAKQAAENMVLFGTGGQAASQLEAVLSVRNIRNVKVVGLQEEKTRAFAERMQREYESSGVAVSSCSDVDAAVGEADIITTVTSSSKPVFDGGRVKDGAHINGVGSYTHLMQELDEHIIIKADRVFVDSREAALAEAGDLIIPIKKGLIGEDRISGELGELLSGKLTGRTDSGEITVFKTVGLAVTDVVTAHAIYKKALSQGIGTNID